MTYDFDTAPERRGTDSNKWSQYAPDVLPMWVADMDFAVAPAIVVALQRRAAHPVYGYATADAALRELLVASLAERYDWRVSVDEIVFLPGVEPGFNMALKALTVPGDGVMVDTPVYRPILRAPGHWGLTRLDVPLVRDGQGGWAADRDRRRALLPHAKAYLLCNPHNPVGKAFRRDELEAIAADCVETDTWIVSDEIHCDLLFDGRRHVPMASLDEAVAQRTVTLMAASKTFNVAGLKTAFAVIRNAALRARFDASRLGMVDSVNAFGLEATRAAYAEGEPWRQDLIAYLAANRDWLHDAIASRLPMLETTRPEATFLTWVDCSALALPIAPQAHFLEHGRVAFSAGADFGEGHEQCIRINFGCTRATLEEGFERLVGCVR